MNSLRISSILTFSSMSFCSWSLARRSSPMASFRRSDRVFMLLPRVSISVAAWPVEVYFASKSSLDIRSDRVESSLTGLVTYLVMR